MQLKSRNKIDSNFSMASMTDIIFLLLVFFLLTSTASPPNVLNLKLPQANGNSIQEEKTVVSIDNGGNFYVDATQVPKQNIESELKARFQGNTQPQFILQAEENTYTKDVVYIMEIANRNGFQMVLATEPNE